MAIRPFWRHLLETVIVFLLLLVGLAYLVSRIDRAEPLSAEQMTLKPGAVELTSDSGFDRHVYADYLKANAMSPVDYVVDKFRTHDLVMLGEAHQIREDCQLVAQLVEPLYRRAGVKMLAMEIIKHKRTDEINRLLTAPAYDSQRVVQIFREDYFYWGFQEYLDILRAVWTFNQTLAHGEEPFRVMGFQPDIDVYRADCGTIMQKLPEFPVLLRSEKLYARPILDEARNKHTKMLVQVGYFHTFLNYRQPKVIDGKMYGEMDRVRMGRLLKQELGDKVFQIDLHVRHDEAHRYTDEPRDAVLCLLERLYAENGSVPIGFDIQNSPFAMLRDTSSWFFAFQKHVTLSDLAQGYILQAPFEKLHTVKWVDGFVNPSNFKMLRTYALQSELMTVSEGSTPEELQQELTSVLADGQRFP
jgi:hypothetical protein